MKAADLDKAFDNGADIDDFVDWSTLRRPNAGHQHRLEIELSTPMVEDLEHRARQLGLTPEALIQSWVAEKLA